MTARRRQPRRAGYTLIELLVASAIATLLMLALYQAFDLTVTQTNIGRERVAHTDLTRAVIARMSGDIGNTLGLLPPLSGQMASGGGSGSGTTPTTPTTPAPADPTAPAEEAPAETGALLPLQSGVIGDSQQLTLFVSKVPVWLLQRANSTQADAQQVLPPDQKRVMYYFVQGVGLCRQERPWVTAAGTGDTTSLDTSNAANEVLAPEVTAVTFEYQDGTGWLGSWDGGSGATDDSAMSGPPRAVRVTLILTLPTDSGGTTEKTVVHVFPIRAGIGLYSSGTTTGGQ